MDPLCQSFNIDIGQGDAAIGPIDSALHVQATFAQTMNTDSSTKRRFLRRHFSAARSGEYRFVVCLANDAKLVGPFPIRCVRVIKPEEDPERAAVIYPDDVESAQWRCRIAGMMYSCSAATADRDIMKTCEKPVVTRTYGERKAFGIDQYPGRRLRNLRCFGRMQSSEQQKHGAAKSPAKTDCVGNQYAQFHVKSGPQTLAHLLIRTLIALCATCLAGVSSAAVFPMPPPGSNMVGTLQVVTIANPESTLLDIARHFDLGYHEITAANPAVSAWVPKVGTRIIVPTEFILPPGPYEGIVVNIPQRRLFYFTGKSHDKPTQVITFPVSISRAGWSTPLGKTRIVAKYRDPSWIVPDSIQEEHLHEGETDYPSYFPPGPDNPMGMLALETGFPMIFIHGTNKPWGVGMRTSHGCLHLYPEDAAYLFPRVKSGTPVRIIDQPHTIGVRDGVLYMGSSEPVSEYPNELSTANRAVAALFPYTGQNAVNTLAHFEIDWPRVFTVATAHRYLPLPISRNAPDQEHILESISAEPYVYKPYDSAANNAAPPMEELQHMESANHAIE